MKRIANPHDRLFREIWSDREVAADFLTHYLPAGILRSLDLSNLEICKDSFIEKELRDFFSDLLYKVGTTGGPGYIYMLFEHKSHADRLAPLQILEYMPKIWRLDLKQNQGKRKPSLPIIIPILLYHGKKKWEHGREFSALFGETDERLSACIPNFEYILQDLTEYTDDEIRGAVVTRVTLLIFKHIFDSDIVSRLPGILTLLNELSESRTGLEYLEKLFRYLLSTVEDLTRGKMKDIVEKSLSENEEELVMTLAERLRNEGIELGYEHGVRQGLIEAIDLGLCLKFGHRDEKLMARIRNIQDLEKLRYIKDSLIKIDNLSDIEI